MENKNMDMMKKLIEEKKSKGLKGAMNQRANKNMGKQSKGFNNTKNGGVFDK